MPVDTKSPVPLSVIIPTFKRPDALDRILAALEEQVTGNPEYSVIVVNDGSHSRAYADVVAGYPWINYLTHETNRGGGAARNTGARQAAGLYLVFTDDDCIPAPSWLDWLVAVIHEYPWLAAIAGPTRLYPMESPTTSQLYVSASGTNPKPGFSGDRLRVMPTANLAIERNWFHKAGGFDENRRYGNDVLLTQRLVELGAPVRIDHDWFTFHENYGLLGVLDRTYRYGKSHGWRLAVFDSEEHDGKPIKSFSSFLHVLVESALKKRGKELIVPESWHEKIFFRTIDIIRNMLVITGRWHGYRAGIKLRQKIESP